MYKATINAKVIITKTNQTELQALAIQSSGHSCSQELPFLFLTRNKGVVRIKENVQEHGIISCVKSKILKSAYHKATLAIVEDIGSVQLRCLETIFLKTYQKSPCTYM